MDKATFILGWLMGRKIAGMRTKKDKFLYGGVTLPAIPDGNQMGCPYTMVFYDEKNAADSKPVASVCLMSEPCVRTNILKGMQLSGTCIKYALVEDLSTWEEWGGFLGLPEIMTAANVWCYNTTLSGDDIKVANYNSKPIWANFDILNQDGTVYYEKSDPPIPV